MAHIKGARGPDGGIDSSRAEVELVGVPARIVLHNKSSSCTTCPRKPESNGKQDVKTAVVMIQEAKERRCSKRCSTTSTFATWLQVSVLIMIKGPAKGLRFCLQSASLPRTKCTAIMPGLSL